MKRRSGAASTLEAAFRCDVRLRSLCHFGMCPPFPPLALPHGCG